MIRASLTAGSVSVVPQGEVRVCLCVFSFECVGSVGMQRRSWGMCDLTDLGLTLNHRIAGLQVTQTIILSNIVQNNHVAKAKERCWAFSTSQAAEDRVGMAAGLRYWGSASEDLQVPVLFNCR